MISTFKKRFSKEEDSAKQSYESIGTINDNSKESISTGGGTLKHKCDQRNKRRLSHSKNMKLNSQCFDEKFMKFEKKKKKKRGGGGWFPA